MAKIMGFFIETRGRLRGLVNGCLALAAFVIAVPTLSMTSEVRHIQGQLEFWTARACVGEGRLCDLPRPIGRAYLLEASYEVPTRPGTHKIVNLTVVGEQYTARIEQFWVQKQTPEKSYIITQTKLSSQAGELIALCTRYDDPHIFKRFPPGACSGRVGDQLVGISVGERELAMAIRVSLPAILKKTN